MLEGHGAVPVDEEIPSRDDVLWAAAMTVPDRASPVIVWLEPARPLPPGELNDPRAESCRWVIGLETLLGSDEPLDEFGGFLRLAAGALSDTVALLDVWAERWYSRAQLDAIARCTDMPLPAELLWTIHLVDGSISRTGEQPPADAPVWIHTHGLHRCGRPELEMLEVPYEHARGAAAILHDLAESFIDGAVAAPGDVVPVSNNASVSLQRWEDVVQHVDRDSPGHMSDRKSGQEEDPDHTGARAVVCDPNPRGAFRKIWTWPSEAVAAVGRDDAVVWRMHETTERHAALARGTWPDLAMALASNGHSIEGDEPELVVLVKVGFSVEERDDAAREHLWFDVGEFAGDRAHGKLLNAPLHLPSLKEGDMVWIERSRVSDWKLLSPRGSFQPADVLLRPAELLEAVQAESS